MIFNLNTCKSDSKECSRYYRADECCTVSADNHCDCCVCRIYPKLVSDTDQNRKQSEEVRICTEQSSINLVSMQVRIASFLSGYLLVRYGSYPFSSTNIIKSHSRQFLTVPTDQSPSEPAISSFRSDKASGVRFHMPEDPVCYQKNNFLPEVLQLLL